MNPVAGDGFDAPNCKEDSGAAEEDPEALPNENPVVGVSVGGGPPN